MGLLPVEYDKELLSKQLSKPATPVTPTPTPVATATMPAPTTSIEKSYDVAIENVQKDPIRFAADLSPEQQVAKFGGAVGSPEYFSYKAAHPYTSMLPQQVLGSIISLPDQETWDKMHPTDKIANIATMGTLTTIKGILSVPKTFARTAAGFGYSGYNAWKSIAQGKGFVGAIEEESPQVPFLGATPSYWKTYDEAVKSGVGPVMATVATANRMLGDAFILGTLGEGIAAALRPRSKLKPGEQISNIEPIKTALVEEQGKMKVISKTESGSEYYSLPRTLVKEKYGGNPNNTFLKVTPSAEGAVEVSIVQRRSGAVPRTVDYVKDKLGIPTKTYQGDFGPEVKLDSQIIKTGKFSVADTLGEINSLLVQEARKYKSAEEFVKAQTPRVGGIAPELQGQTLYRGMSDAEWQAIQAGGVSGKASKGGRTFLTTERQTAEMAVEAGKGKGVVVELKPEAGQKVISGGKIGENTGGNLPGEYQARNIGIDDIAKVTDGNGKVIYEATTGGKTKSQLTDIWNKAQEKSTVSGIANETIAPIPPKALKGFENKPITMEQSSNLGTISRVNGIEPGIQDAVIRSVTGKKSIGELTQKEYVDVAQTLSTFNNVAKYSPQAGSGNWVSQIVSPQRHWMRTYEEKTGIPLYSEVYVPVEDGMRLRTVFRDSYRNEAREIFGEYAGQGFGEYRRLIKNYMEGDTSAIKGNSTLTPKVQADLISIAEKMRPLYDKLGETFGIPTEVFLKDYQPHIQDIGGIHQISKAGSEVPKELSFFAEFKRHGSLQTQVDDALALFDIYTNAGSNKLFLGDAMERISKFSEKLPDRLKGSIKSYVQEKLGNAGWLEQRLDELGKSVGDKLGLNVPPDVARQVTGLMMDTTYAGAMGLNPASVIRNSFQYDLLAYPRLGPRYYTDALKKALSKEGMKEVRDAGFLVELGVPYGEQLAQDVNVFGRAGNTYRKITQATLAPYSMADNLGRARAYFQTKFQFEDALAKYNSGKLTWGGLEKELDFGALSAVDRNIIRQRLIGGDQKGAFEHLVRDVIDDTQFPYRTGSSARATYGLAGKLGTQFGQYSIEFAHTMARWIKNGITGAAKGDFSQFDKLARFYAASSAIHRTFSENFGIDFRKSLGVGSVSPTLSPLINTAISFMDMINGLKRDNAEVVNSNWKEITRTLLSLGLPAGVAIRNWNQFLTSYKKGPIGPDGQFGVFDDRGRLKYYTTFNDIFWQMWGFPTNEREEQSRLQSDLRNAKFNYSKIKSNALELLQQEKYDEANDLINQYGIKITADDMDQYFIPLTQRTFESLPGALKAEFAPRVFKQ